MKRLTILCAMLCTMYVFTSCSNEEPKNPIDDDNTPVEPFTVLVPQANWPLTETQMLQGSQMNDFAFRLFRQLQKPNESLVLSPLSVDYALAMVALGAEGETRDALVKALGVDVKEPQALHNLMASLMAYLPSVDENVKINLANAFFLNASRKELSINPDYQKVLQENYKAACEAVKTDTQEGIDQINAWCSKQTDGFIPKVFESPLTQENVCLFINALYFKGDWFLPFDPNYTHERNFKCENGENVMVQCMNNNNDLDYAESELFQAVRLPYGKTDERGVAIGDPSSFGMTILLPCEGKTTADILSWLTSEHFAALSEEMEISDVVISLPRFETNVSTNLLDAFEQLKLPFNCDDLRGMVLSDGKPRSLNLADAFQCARIKVDEKGTEAGAVTVIDFSDSMPINRKVFIADHPFVYLLTEEQTGSILFVGTYHGK